MAHGDKIALLKKALSNLSLTVQQVNSAYPILEISYINSMIVQNISIIKDGKSKITGKWRYRYKPELDVPGNRMAGNYQHAARKKTPPRGSFQFMLPEKMACLRRRMKSNYTSEKDKDILQAIYRDYQGLVRSGVGS